MRGIYILGATVVSGLIVGWIGCNLYYNHKEKKWIKTINKMSSFRIRKGKGKRA